MTDQYYLNEKLSRQMHLPFSLFYRAESEVGFTLKEVRSIGQEKKTGQGCLKPEQAGHQER